MKHVDLSTESGEAVPQFLMDRLDPFRTAFTEPTWRLARVLAMGGNYSGTLTPTNRKRFFIFINNLPIYKSIQ